MSRGKAVRKTRRGRQKNQSHQRPTSRGPFFLQFRGFLTNLKLVSGPQTHSNDETPAVTSVADAFGNQLRRCNSTELNPAGGADKSNWGKAFS